MGQLASDMKVVKKQAQLLACSVRDANALDSTQSIDGKREWKASERYRNEDYSETIGVRKKTDMVKDEGEDGDQELDDSEEKEDDD
jgi:hypothetical protein